MDVLIFIPKTIESAKRTLDRIIPEWMTHRTPCQKGNNMSRRTFNGVLGPKPKITDELQQISEVATGHIKFNLNLWISVLINRWCQGRPMCPWGYESENITRYQWICIRGKIGPQLFLTKNDWRYYKSIFLITAKIYPATMPGIMNNSYAASRQQAMRVMKRSCAATHGLFSLESTHSQQQSRRTSIDSSYSSSSSDYQRRSSIDSAFASLSMQDNDMELDSEWGHFVDM